MKVIADFLSSPLWQGVQGLLAVLAIVISLKNPRKWLEKNSSTKWLTKTPWIWLFMAAGVATGASLMFGFSDIVRGTFAALGSTSLGFGYLWAQSSRSSSYSNELLVDMNSKYWRLTSGLRRVVHLVPSEFKLVDWRLSHVIDEDGSGSLREELTIVPLGEPVYFYFKRFALSTHTDKQSIEVTARNLVDNTPQSVFELERRGGYVHFVVLLDPPSTVTSPKRIAITCDRGGIWTDLIDRHEDEGFRQVSHEADSICIELVAPRRMKWKGFHPAPVVGNVEIETSGSLSRVAWTVHNPRPRKYAYQTFLESKM